MHTMPQTTHNNVGGKKWTLKHGDLVKKHQRAETMLAMMTMADVVEAFTLKKVKDFQQHSTAEVTIKKKTNNKEMLTIL